MFIDGVSNDLDLYKRLGKLVIAIPRHLYTHSTKQASPSGPITKMSGKIFETGTSLAIYWTHRNRQSHARWNIWNDLQLRRSFYGHLSRASEDQ
jgi:hypothetical protein